jgi:hypothetical protein
MQPKSPESKASVAGRTQPRDSLDFESEHSNAGHRSRGSWRCRERRPVR